MERPIENGENKCSGTENGDRIVIKHTYILFPALLLLHFFLIKRLVARDGKGWKESKRGSGMGIGDGRGITFKGKCIF